MATQGRGCSDADRTLFVGNLDSRVREEILYELFLQAGPVTKVTICKDKDGKPKTFGFACFKHTESVPYAIALLNGIRLYGRPIKVQYRFGSSHCPELSNHCQNMENSVDIQSPTYSPFQVNSSPPQGYSALQNMMSNFLAQQYTPYPMGQQFPFYQMMTPPPPPFPRLPLSPYPNYLYSEPKNHMLHLVSESRPKRKRYQETSDSDSSIENDRKKTKRK